MGLARLRVPRDAMSPPRVACPHCKAVFGWDAAGGRQAPCPACGGLLRLPVPPSVEPLWYYAQARRKVGPVPLTELRQLAADGRLGPADMVLRQGSSKWVAAADVP